MATATLQSPHRSHSVRLVPVMVAFAAALMIIAASSPSRAQALSGTVGPVNAPLSVCQVTSLGKQVYVAVPAVYSSNRFAGTGNDRQLVKYWTRLVYANGQAMTGWSFAGEAWANDNVAAALPVYWKFNGYPIHVTLYNQKWGPVAITTSSTAQYWVAWYDASGRLIGDQQYYVPGFHGWTGAGYVGTASLC